MRILVDANIIIDKLDRKGYASRFFRQAMREHYQLFILTNAYSEVLRITGEKHKLDKLISELRKYDIYNKVGLNDDEISRSKQLFKECVSSFGYDLGRTDRHLVSIALKRNLVLFTKDKDLNALAKKTGVKLFRHAY